MCQGRERQSDGSGWLLHPNTRKLGPTPGLVAEWTFDEGTGQTAADSSGLGNGATLGNAPGVDPADPAWAAP
jgi:hypothetical protein